MAKDFDSRQNQLRQLVAQQAARMMAEEGISDYAFAKKKAGRQLGIVDMNCLPTNAEIADEIKLFHEIYHTDDQPQALKQLRADALTVMNILERFNPHLTGTVLDGTAGLHAETHIHLFADSLKDVEMFLLNSQIPYETTEKSFRVNNDKRGASKKGNERKKVPVFTLEAPNGMIKLSVFEVDDMRLPTKHTTGSGNASRANIASVQALIQQSRGE
jgi:hypothetical protein